MILHALKEYYDRKAADPDSGIAPPGWEWKELPFLIVIDSVGKPIAIEDTREEVLVGKKKQKRAKRFLVPQAVKRTASGYPNILWDNPEYTLGVFSDKKKADGKKDDSATNHASFIEKTRSLNLSSDAGVAAVFNFLDCSNKVDDLANFPEWSEILKDAPFLSFRLQGEKEPVFRSSAVVAALSAKAVSERGSGFCLVSGNDEPAELTHPAIKGVRDANGTGANIVGFNSPAFCSHGHEQGANAPVGKTAAFAYTTALNSLLGKDSRQRMLVGDATTVFWAAKADDFENQVANIFGEPPKDDPDRLVNAVKSLYRATETGIFVTDTDDTRFYVLGLSPNTARLAIRFWHTGTVAEMAGRFRAHFDAIDICHGPNEPEYLSLWRLLVSIAQQGKSENIPPHIAGDTMRAILTGLPYPASLFQAVIIRVKAERTVSYPRAALIKAYLNRTSNKEEIHVSLDPENTNIGYRLGRLFAALERIQEAANPGINATIRDRFYAAASGTPVTVFGNLLRLKNHHLAKLENPGYRVNLEKLLGEIFSGISDFPAHLSLEDQGRFAIGYYHQRQSFFTKNAAQQGE